MDPALFLSSFPEMGLLLLVNAEDIITLRPFRFEP